MKYRICKFKDMSAEDMCNILRLFDCVYNNELGADIDMLSSYDEEAVYAIAETADECIIGAIKVIPYTSKISDTYERLLLADVGVNKYHRGLGICKRLYNNLLAEFPKLSRITLMSLPESIDYWESLGFIRARYYNSTSTGTCLMTNDIRPHIGELEQV